MAVYQHIVVAGTFDHFHDGHKALLDAALAEGNKVTIGVTDGGMISAKVLSERIEHYKARLAQVQAYVHQQRTEDVAFICITDIYGNVLTDPTVDAIIATEAAMENIRIIQAARKKQGLQELAVITVPLVLSEEDTPISSTSIRLGLIDRTGRSFLKPFRVQPKWEAPQAVRNELRVPVGDIYTGPEDDLSIAVAPVVQRIQEEKPTLLISVGDIVTQSLQQAGIAPDISFVDYRSRRTDRKDIDHSAVQRFGPFRNKAGSISSAIALLFSDLIVQSVKTKEHLQIVIEGEEDLFGLVAILLAPLESVMVYGQFDQGIVYVPVTEEQKNQSLVTVEHFI